jgi:BRCA1/BRCA2-containing complex subunit 3
MLVQCVLSREVFSVCCMHALTTEQEEIMGLLLGDTSAPAAGEQRGGGGGSSSSSGGGGGVVVEVWGVSVQTRSDRRKDRVEISPEALSSAAEDAERLARVVGRRTRVIGWYHSHPHITVQPSNVDLGTQFDYQRLDAGFVGIILSCFGRGAETSGRQQLIAFQSAATSEGGQRGFQRVEVPIAIRPLLELVPTAADVRECVRVSLSNLVKLQSTLLFEEKQAYVEATFVDEAEQRGEPPAPHTLRRLSSSAATSFHSLALLLPLAGRAPRHPLSAVHNAAVYEKTLCRVLEHGCFPLQEVLRQQGLAAEREFEELRAANARLEAELQQQQES